MQFIADCGIFLIRRNLSPVTQLYVSVDASTKDSLKKIDRPLFRDFWERFTESLKALSDKVCNNYKRYDILKLAFSYRSKHFFQGQRTVYRLTLVKAWNTDEIRNYADLVQLGRPDFIEVKVTSLHCCNHFLM